ncbi:ABC-2 type transport system ATP-binding protein [Streptomyces sp. SceaMP-e96]|uniref:ABC transporter ATP-binding protein n=1 Tax=Streptomyces TaxID=1883 RepID=UPI0008239917|nr:MULTISPECIES: ABC transporter ATP-binding protein [unclassified Streptomyces]MYT16144.1 ATP-binding cassette domain-containing protein [Streptomyces sp. SID4951]SCK30635.1 ABC-2 type transport system ATP-binding protein [Streptomyces sp. SceaMP-e96]
MITLNGLTKCYGGVTAVEDLQLEIEPGRVTGFLGPNGAGKSTTMRMILGLDRPTAGKALVNGKRYEDLRYPTREVGALLEAKALHPGRSAHKHLLAMARSNGIPGRRVDEVLETVGLTSVAKRKVGLFSLGMGQRLGIAGALLGDPGVLIFDEPVNGLDPDGVRWVRRIARSLAEEGRTVFISSHLMSEMQQTADQLVIIGRGKLIADEPMEQLIQRSSLGAVRLRVPEPHSLAELERRIASEGFTVDRSGGDVLTVRGASAERIGDIAYETGARLHELHVQAPSLEEAYMELTASSVEYGTHQGNDAEGQD